MPTPLPPPQYDHPPAIPVIEFVLPAAEVNKKCREIAAVTGPAFPANGVTGCTFVGGKQLCLIVRIDDAAVRRHELAHCNAWPNDHPGGVKR